MTQVQSTYVQLPKAMNSETAGKLRKLRIRQKEAGAVVVDFNDFREPRGRRDGGRRDGGGYRGNRGKVAVTVSVVKAAVAW